MIEVIRAGALTTVQDRGRYGWAHLGVPRAGALDQPALALANRLVGNPPDAAGLEITLTGCTLRLRTGGWVALAGAPATVRIAGRSGGFLTSTPVPPDAVVEIGPTRYGVRSYLAVAGGIAVPAVLGSRSTDTLAGIGPPTVRDGDVLPVGTAPPPAALGRAAADAVPWSAPVVPVRLAVRLGPRADWFTDEAVQRLLTTGYEVSPLSNRIGVRLTGAPLTRSVRDELPSEGLVLGAVQVPADGQPLVFLADHPTTGGYPVVGVVDDVTPLAQARPGTTVRFHGSQRGPR
ncbi:MULTISPECIES: biotin-dependent carboxyltransferase family protein [unclassified Solwaraspora]|uniref:5-oxoprolinase subunit C family protein n=1 Tax=unclassified Solwaraspora TaxID=2627926 RepID=UPI00248D0504|nr:MULTISPECIES: biotin-dependent carboxyltransferase family protein [unclassified Solwaraspora]WBB96950.1 biotin-dependent carboxyltransferase family protein [Solwaraspora sp. WMMA2059]WBC19146.1 biotin-dependent carboxyltransferase family protein [Solwaraspora sp. WMMA2080]WJK33439.1 biotin-dependent carboxyltransferase family protein [Solwaraspora sp. WMMA2065]